MNETHPVIVVSPKMTAEKLNDLLSDRTDIDLSKVIVIVGKPALTEELKQALADRLKMQIVDKEELVVGVNSALPNINAIELINSASDINLMELINSAPGLSDEKMFYEPRINNAPRQRFGGKDIYKCNTKPNNGYIKKRNYKKGFR